MLSNDLISNIWYNNLYLCNKGVGGGSHIYLIVAPRGFIPFCLILRTKTSRFHHPCQRSRQSPGFQQGRTGAWTRLSTNSGKRPGKDWWQRSERRQYDKTPPQKAPTASKSTSPRPRPDSEDRPAPIIEEQFRTPSDSHQHQHKLIWTQTTTDAQRSTPHPSTADDRSVEITGQHTHRSSLACHGIKSPWQMFNTITITIIVTIIEIIIIIS